MIAACEHYHIGVAKRLFREDLRKSFDLLTSRQYRRQMGL
jgi:hypothetical protein